MMKIEEYTSLSGVPMILLLDEENNTSLSMAKSTYDEMIAKREASTL